MIYLYGAGGHSKVVVDILERSGKRIAGIFDDDPAKQFWNFPNLKFPGPFDLSSDELIITIGNNLTRKKISMQTGANYCSAIHPSAIISTHSSIAAGSVVMGGGLINADSSVGKHCIINSNASVDHDCILEDFVHISPNATICGEVIIGACSHVGAGAIIIPCKRIGSNVTIGAGAVIISDIPDNAVVVGNPGRIVKMKE